MVERTDKGKKIQMLISGLKWKFGFISLVDKNVPDSDAEEQKMPQPPIAERSMLLDSPV